MTPAVAPYWVERRVTAMGSAAVITVGDADTAVAEWAVDELARLEAAWSRFRHDSELAGLNARPGEWVAVSRRLLLAVRRAVDLWEATAGAFDPSVLEALERAGYDRPFAALDRADPEPAGAPQPASGCAGVEIDEAGSAARLPAGCRLDLGGVGKGLAADLLAEGLIDRGARSALVALGGDIRICGQPPEGGWRIPVEDPFTDGHVLFEHTLTGGAIVTSTTLIRTWHRAGRRYHHIIDPRRGIPVRSDVAAVVATAPAAWWAEGIAKAAVVLGRSAGGDLLHRCGVSAWMFGHDGSLKAVGGDRDEAPCSPR